MANYGLFKNRTFTGEKGSEFRVNIFKKAYTNLIANSAFDVSSIYWTIFNCVFTAGVGARFDSLSFSKIGQTMSTLEYGTNYLVTIKLEDLPVGQSIYVRIKGSNWIQLHSSNVPQGIWERTLSTPADSGSAASGHNDGIEIHNNNNGIYNSVLIKSVCISPSVNLSVPETLGNTYNTEDIAFSDECFNVVWNGSGSTRDRNFLGSECKLNLYIRNDLEEEFLYDLLDGGPKDFFIRIYKDDYLWWFGYMQPSFDVIENVPYPYNVTLTATDSYGYYNNTQFKEFETELSRQNNYDLPTILSDFFRNMDISAVNLVSNGTFTDGSSRGWIVLDSDVVTANNLAIDAVNSPGTRRALSCDEGVLEAGREYVLQVTVTATSGTLYIKDGGGQSGTIATITSANDGVNLTFTWTQSDNPAQSTPELNGLHFYSNDFVGSIAGVSAYLSDELPMPQGADYMNVNLMWEHDSFVAGLANCSQYYLCKGAFATNTNFPLEYKDQEVFEEALKIFNLVGFLAEGVYWFIQPNSLTHQSQLLYSPFDRSTALATNIDQESLYIKTIIDQDNHAILGGSSFTFEAPLKSVSATFTSVESAFNISSQQDLLGRPWVSPQPEDEYYTYGGQALADTTYTLDWFSIYSEHQPTSNLPETFGYDTHPGMVRYETTVFIKAVSSTRTDWLTINSDGDLEWQNTYKGVELARGQVINPATNVHHNSLFSSDFNESTKVGALKNGRYNQVRDGDIITIDRNDVGGRNYTPPPNPTMTTRGDLKFKTEIPQLDETCSIYVKVESSFIYVESRLRQNSQIVTPINALLIDKEHTAQSITLTAEETNSLVTQEFRVTEYSNNPTSTENFDLGGVVIGQTASDVQFSITNRDNEPLTGNVYVDVNDQEPFTQFLAKQYLELQQSPLKILQASIQSNNVSPLRIIRYSVNDDGNYEDYAFLGGTFRAKSEIMDGEWFRLKND